LSGDAALSDEESQTFTVTAMGPIGHIYFAEAKTDSWKTELAHRLVKQGKIPGVLHRDQGGTIIWFHAEGETVVPGEGSDLLDHHPASLREDIARDIIALCENRNAGDLIILGWSKLGAWTFAAERGAHGGLGPDETQGFLLGPPDMRLPAGTEDRVRPADLRAAGLSLLERASLKSTRATKTREEKHLRVMTYNTHSCGGMDGRVSPRRIARAIQQYSPDLVALQELDLGRSRSRGEDQATLIAEALDYHVIFCPTVKHSDTEHYGHALLSRRPLEVIKVATLPDAPRTMWPESRGALWAQIEIEGARLNIVTTHLGLSPRERKTQMQALLGDDWLGPIIKDEPVILCGDFNLAPRSAPYRMAVAKLRDVQTAKSGHRARGTFSSMRPFMRLDHIFVSEHFGIERVLVPRNDLTRVASDHLPLLADLSISSGDGETPTHTPR